jgi:hypothetical protein
MGSETGEFWRKTDRSNLFGHQSVLYVPAVLSWLPEYGHCAVTDEVGVEVVVMMIPPFKKSEK